MKKAKICLDAGHYGKYNQSAVEPAFYESDFNWKHHLLLKKYLEEYGIEVILTRSDKEKDMDLYDRGRCAAGCDLFLSIHANWAARKTADYPVSYVPINGSGDALGLKLAKCVAEVMGTTEPGEIQSKKSTKGEFDWYGVIYGAASVGVPGIILEHSFYSNERSVKWLMVDSNLDKLAKAEAEVIAAHYGVIKPTEEGRYLVISGAYTVRQNAVSQLTAVRKFYPDAIMIKAGGYYKVLIDRFTTNAEAQRKVTEGKGKGLSCYISTDANMTVEIGKEPAAATPTYTHKQFVTDVQIAIGAAADGIAGNETIRKTPAVGADKNARHAVVKPLQRYLKELGYDEVGTVDGIAGAKFTSAIGNYQQDKGIYVTGDLHEWDKTWHKLLGMD